MGVAQLVHTPMGAPATAPQSTFAAACSKRFGRRVRARKVIMAAPKGRAKYMPKRLVQSQFIEVRPTRVASGMVGLTGKSASKEMAALTLSDWPACSFLSRAG